MSQRMTTYDKIKELLDVNMAMLTVQIEMNRELVKVKLAELKEDTQEIKAHAKETNGYVNANLEKIRKLEEFDNRSKRIWKTRWYSITAIVFITVMLAIIAHEVGLFTFLKYWFNVTH